MTFAWYGLEVPGIAPLDCDRGELDDRFRGILLSGAGESHWVLSVFNSSVENDSGSHHAHRLLPLFRDIFDRPIPMELRCGVRVHRRCSVLHVLRIAMVEMIHVQSGPRIDQIRALFTEYARSLDFSLCFQSFDRELRELPMPYSLPDGRLFLCEFEGAPAGCIALKKLESGICEMKRLYVRPDFRGHQLGSKLATHLIREARTAGYSRM